LNHGKCNNFEDALIAEVAIVNGHTLITADEDLRTVAEQHGCNVAPLAKYKTTQMPALYRCQLRTGNND
jgi:hypothetical protein